MFSLIFLLFYQAKANITCYGCEYINWRYESALWPCDQSAGPWKTLSNCTACIKQTEVQASDFKKPRWGQEATILKTISRYCVVHFPAKYPDQCVFFYGSSTVIEQCFCSTDYCNESSQHKPNLYITLCFFIALSFSRLRTHNTLPKLHY